MESFALLKFVLLLLPFESCKRNECASRSFAVQKALHTLQRSEKYCRSAQYAAFKQQRHAHTHTNTVHRLHQTLCKYHISGWGMLHVAATAPPKKLQLKRSQAAQNNTRDNLPLPLYPCYPLPPSKKSQTRRQTKRSTGRAAQFNANKPFLLAPMRVYVGEALKGV